MMDYSNRLTGDMQKRFACYLLICAALFANPHDSYSKTKEIKRCLNPAHTLSIRETYEHEGIVAKLVIDNKVVSKSVRPPESGGGLANFLITYNSLKQPLSFFDSPDFYDFQKNMRCETDVKSVFYSEDPKMQSAYFVATQFVKQAEKKAEYAKKKKKNAIR